MTKEEAVKTLMLLSALESWLFSVGRPLPEYLTQDLQETMICLKELVLQKKYDG